MKFVISIILILGIISNLSSSVSSVGDKCSACNAVAAELEIGLSKEKPRNHIDMRHRLDSRGQREGKVIDYRVSDLRVTELLDGLCEKMQDYAFEKVDSGKNAWIKVMNWNNLTIDKQEAKASSKYISSYCSRLLEETEDELSEMIKKGSIQSGGVSKALCQDLSQHCSKGRDSSNVDYKEL